MLGIVAALIIGLAAGNLSQQPADTASEEGASLQAKIANLQDQIDVLTQENLQSQHELNAAEATVKHLQTQLDQTTYDKQQLEKEILSLEKSQEQTNTHTTNVKELQIRLSEAELVKQYLEEQVAAMNATMSDTTQKLETKRAELAKTQDELQAEKNLNEKLSGQATLTQKSLQQLQADKTLLAEMKKEVPTERSKLKEYWENIKPLAAKVNQTLGAKVDNITINISGYMNLTESAPSKDAKPEAWGLWLLNPTREAAYYLKAVDDFRYEAYSVIMRDIDAAKNSQ